MSEPRLKAPLTRVPGEHPQVHGRLRDPLLRQLLGIGGLAGERAAWPLGDVTLLLLFATYAVAGGSSPGLARAPSAAGPGGGRMRKLLQLIFGDLRNVVSVAVALLAAYGAFAARARAPRGALLALLLIGAAALQAF